MVFVCGLNNDSSFINNLNNCLGGICILVSYRKWLAIYLTQNLIYRINTHNILISFQDCLLIKRSIQLSSSFIVCRKNYICRDYLREIISIRNEGIYIKSCPKTIPKL